MTHGVEADFILKTIRSMKEDLSISGKIIPKNEMEFTILMTALRYVEMEVEGSAEGRLANGKI